MSEVERPQTNALDLAGTGIDAYLYIYIYIYIYMCVCVCVCVFQYNQIVAQVSTQNSICNTIVIVTCYILHTKISFI